MTKTKRARRPDVVARCACGERFQARSLDTVNAQLARHYRTCDGKPGPRRK